MQFDLSRNVISQYSDAFASNISFELEKVEVVSQTAAFPVGRIHSFFDDVTLNCVKSEISELPFTRKNGDLYSFWQTSDIKATKAPAILNLKTTLSSPEFISFLSSMTGIELDAHRSPDIAAQRYDLGDHLLCHDDDVMEGDAIRRIAFIIYLVDENWCEADGGALEIFSSSVDRPFPGKVVQRILPSWNTLVFFEVSPISFHQVQEVLAIDKHRLSLTGWYYGRTDNPLKILDNVFMTKPVPRNLETYPDLDLMDWISPEYLATRNISQLREQFFEESVIRLSCFLLPSVSAALVSSMDSCSSIVPLSPNVGAYRALCLPANDIISKFGFLLSSSKFASWLSAITGMDFRFCNGEFQRFDPGSYTLMSDFDKEDSALDLYYTSFPGEWKQEFGGNTVYIHESDTLLNVEPAQNELFLAYRDEDVMRFVKYVSLRSPGSFYRTSYQYT
eukprot:Partr_v1_DN28048_c2_g2_i1_m56694 putative 2-oxoglutarate and iron-dependent oxygenase domain containing 1